MIETTVVKLSKEETALRLSNMQTVINREIDRNELEALTRYQAIDITQLQRDHWRKLHTTRMTPEQLELWIQSIPGCVTCKEKFLKILLVMPPVFGDGWEYWTFAVHNIVNSDIGKPIITYQEACQLWGWN